MVEFVVAFNIILFLCVVGVLEVAMTWYPSHGDQVLVGVVIDIIPEIRFGTLSMWLLLTPLYHRLIVEGEGPNPTAIARGPAPNSFWGPAPQRSYGALPPTA